MQVEDVEKSAAACRGAGDRIDHPADLAHWHPQYQHKSQGFCELAECDGPGQNLLPTDPKRGGHGEEVNETHLCCRVDEQANTAGRDCEGFSGTLVKPRHLVSVCRESAYYPNAPKVFFHDLGEMRHLILQCHPGVPKLKARERTSEGDNRHEAKCHKSKFEIVSDQDHCTAANKAREENHSEEAGVDPMPQALNIQNTARHEVAGVYPVMPRKTELL